MKEFSATEVAQMVARALADSLEFQNSPLMVLDSSLPTVERSYPTDYFQVFMPGVAEDEDGEEISYTIMVSRD